MRPELAALTRRIVAERGITLRSFLEAALLTEIDDPSVITDIDRVRQRAHRGTATHLVSLGALISPGIVHQTRRATLVRGIRQRTLVEGALLREIESPTAFRSGQKVPLTQLA